MNKKMKLIFPAALAAMILGTCSALAAANPSSTNAAPTGGGYASEEGMGITDDDIPFVRSMGDR